MDKSSINQHVFKRIIDPHYENFYKMHKFSRLLLQLQLFTIIFHYSRNDLEIFMYHSFIIRNQDSRYFLDNHMSLYKQFEYQL